MFQSVQALVNLICNKTANLFNAGGRGLDVEEHRAAAEKDMAGVSVSVVQAGELDDAAKAKLLEVVRSNPALNVSTVQYIGANIGSEPKPEPDDTPTAEFMADLVGATTSESPDEASDEESYMPDKKLVKGELDLIAEECQLRSTIAKFFGVSPAGHHWKTIVLESGDTIQTADYESVNIFKRMGELNIILCGGAVTSAILGTKVNDLDFYVVDINDLADAQEFLQQYFPLAINQSINANTMGRKSERKVYHCQLIKKFSGDPEEIFQAFDFTITHGAYSFRSESFVFGCRFFQDLSRRVLVYSGKSNYPICALYRTIKYTKRGFTAAGSTLMHIALCIVQLKIENYAQLKEQLMGIDTMYLQGLLSKLDPDAPVDYGYFVDEAFRRINRINGKNEAATEEEEEQ